MIAGGAVSGDSKNVHLMQLDGAAESLLLFKADVVDSATALAAAVEERELSDSLLSETITSCYCLTGTIKIWLKSNIWKLQILDDLLLMVC